MLKAILEITLWLHMLIIFVCEKWACSSCVRSNWTVFNAYITGTMRTRSKANAYFLTCFNIHIEDYSLRPLEEDQKEITTVLYLQGGQKAVNGAIR